MAGIMRKKKTSSIDRSVVDSPEWAMVLDNLEQMQPRYLAGLLRSGGLQEVIRSRLVAYARTLERLREKYPDRPMMELLEVANEVLVPVNQDWQDQEPLNAEEAQLLRAFRKSSLR